MLFCVDLPPFRVRLSDLLYVFFHDAMLLNISIRIISATAIINMVLPMLILFCDLVCNKVCSLSSSISEQRGHSIKCFLNDKPQRLQLRNVLLCLILSVKL